MPTMRDQGAAARTTPRGVCAHCHRNIRVMAFLDDPYCSIDCQKNDALTDDEDTTTP